MQLLESLDREAVMMTCDAFLALAQQSPLAPWTAFDLLQQQAAALVAEFAAQAIMHSL